MNDGDAMTYVKRSTDLHNSGFLISLYKIVSNVLYVLYVLRIDHCYNTATASLLKYIELRVGHVWFQK